MPLRSNQVDICGFSSMQKLRSDLSFRSSSENIHRIVRIGSAERKLENDSFSSSPNYIFFLKDPVVGPNSGILLREHEPVPVSSYYDGSAPSATNHYFHQNKRGQIIFQPQAKAEPFNDSTAAMNLQRRSSMPLLPAKFVSTNPKPKYKSSTLHTEESEKPGLIRNLDENENDVAKVLPSYSSNVGVICGLRD